MYIPTLGLVQYPHPLGHRSTTVVHPNAGIFSIVYRHIWSKEERRGDALLCGMEEKVEAFLWSKAVAFSLEAIYEPDKIL